MQDGVNYRIAIPNNVENESDKSWRLFKMENDKPVRVDDIRFEIPFFRVAWHKTTALMHGASGILKVYGKNGRVWHLNDVKRDFEIIACLGSEEKTSPENLMAFRKTGGKIVPVDAVKLASDLDSKLKTLPMNYLTPGGRILGLTYRTPEKIEAQVLTGAYDNVKPPHSLIPLEEGQEPIASLNMLLVDVSDSNGTRMTYRLPHPKATLTQKTQAKGYYIPDMDDVKTFHYRWQERMPAALTRRLTEISFYPVAGLGNKDTNQKIAGDYMAMGDAKDKMSLYGFKTVTRKDWVTRMTGRLLSHELGGHGVERGDEEIRELVLSCMMLDGAVTEYGDTNWREYFAVLCEFFYFEPEFRHRFPWGYRLIYTLLLREEAKFAQSENPVRNT